MRMMAECQYRLGEIVRYKPFFMKLSGELWEVVGITYKRHDVMLNLRACDASGIPQTTAVEQHHVERTSLLETPYRWADRLIQAITSGEGLWDFLETELTVSKPAFNHDVTFGIQLIGNGWMWSFFIGMEVDQGNLVEVLGKHVLHDNERSLFQSFSNLGALAVAVINRCLAEESAARAEEAG